MSKKNVTTVKKSFSSDELENLRNNILKKVAQENTTLKKLAEKMDMEYQTLRRITYEQHAPNIKALYPIAKYFNVSISDLLKSPNLPQYVPMLSFIHVEDYLNSKLCTADFSSILSEEYIHPQAFALGLQVTRYGMTATPTFIMKPYSKVNLNSLLLIKSGQSKYHFVKVLQSTEFSLEAMIIPSEQVVTFNLDNLQVLGLAIREVTSHDLF